ncbi:hypothetical protein CMEL01_03409 [Colletotrichum melonis]|uniref:Uncharacterized protein n=1 Tax=Colletotrichum melonis TaxID=1209925 RepID=A0AAI9UES4_9PEZI|nr:hypothetical protein CMEL01_03409 [Colletotrichum melonis]
MSQFLVTLPIECFGMEHVLKREWHFFPERSSPSCSEELRRCYGGVDARSIWCCIADRGRFLRTEGSECDDRRICNRGKGLFGCNCRVRRPGHSRSCSGGGKNKRMSRSATVRHSKPRLADHSLFPRRRAFQIFGGRRRGPRGLKRFSEGASFLLLACSGDRKERGKIHKFSVV